MDLQPSVCRENPSRFQALFNLTTVLNQDLSAKAILERALPVIVQALDASHGLLILRSAQQFHRFHAGEAPGAGTAASQALPIARWVMESEEALIATADEPEPPLPPAMAPGERPRNFFACLPLTAEGHVVAALYLDRASTPLDQEELSFFSALASVTAQALHNARLFEEHEERRIRLEMLSRLHLTISRNLDLETVLDTVVEMVIELSKAERAFILLCEKDSLRFGAGRSQEGPLAPETEAELSMSVCRRVLETRQGFFAFNTGMDEELSNRPSIIKLQLRSILAVPLLGKSGLLGILYVDSKSRVADELEQEMALLSTIASVASLSVESAKLYLQAMTDSLTGLFSRAYFNDRLAEECRRSLRYGGHFSLLVLDLDHFKRVNDTHGHPAGDLVLKTIAQVIIRTLRTGIDLPARVGGEEMVVLLPETDLAGAYAAAERIRNAIEAEEIPCPGGIALRITASIGISAFPETANTPHELFALADQALYASKHGGRNRSTVYQEGLEAKG